MQAVREDVAAAYAADPRLKDLTDADKQEAASIMAYMATVAAASANQLRSDGDQAGLETLQDEVHKAVIGQGLDLAQPRLTDAGFAARTRSAVSDGIARGAPPTIVIVDPIPR